MADLSESEREFLDLLRSGLTVAGAAERMHYSSHWGKWKARQLREKLGVETIRKVRLMADGDGLEPGITRAEFTKLQEAIAATNRAIEGLAESVSSGERKNGESVVQERVYTEKEHAKALGISLEDLGKLREEQDYSRFRAMQERLERERQEAEEEENEPQRDGLGGIRNLTRGGR